MRLSYDEATEAFRAEFVDWVEHNLPPAEERTEPVLSSAHLPDWARAWQRRMFDAGWLVPGWPPEYGGRNATPVQQLVYFEEIARRQIPRGFNPQGLSIITPSILDFGTDEQKQRYALPTLRGEISFCLGMSEPDAGSDLAGLRTRAELQGDQFVVNGQKVWTSGAHHADYCFCFVRTNPDVPKHQGISVLIIDMSTPGISVRPLAMLTDPNEADFNEVFFTDVVVPAENLVGELNHGWSIAGGSLAHERGMLWISSATALERDIDQLIQTAIRPGADGRRLADDPVFSSGLARAYMEAQAMKFMGYRGFAKFARGMESPEHSILKLYGSELGRRLALETTEALWPLSLDLDAAPLTVHGDDPTPWPTKYLISFANTIAGGTSEIQHNIIAERILGLPRR
ncbi:MAG TPA: acyl-CoA dehydrogenase family protein [Acidimicrobiales bacterium]|nr:acyl-CoA dehydrogenase family protein [Acidimicrobiales bacterium]